ncbi:hypothetical protein P4S72_14875 [Vibrio sp. PP-XX7]
MDGESNWATFSRDQPKQHPDQCAYLLGKAGRVFVLTIFARPKIVSDARAPSSLEIDEHVAHHQRRRSKPDQQPQLNTHSLILPQHKIFITTCDAPQNHPKRFNSLK